MLLKLTGERKKRVEEIKDCLIGSPPGICSERARYYTEAYETYESEPRIILRAKALRSYLENKTLYLGDNDLIPGYQASHPRWAPIFPEYSWEWVYLELDSFEKRKYDRFSITPEVKEELRQLLPAWKNKTLFEKVSARQPDFVKKASQIGVTSWIGQATSGEGHIVVDHQMALEEGFAGIISRAEVFKTGLALYEPENLGKRDFLKAVGIALEGVLIFARRLAECAGETAGKEKNNKRKQELIAMAEACSNVPAKPASGFYEALITVWFLHLIQQIESNGHSTSLGRFDQYLYPYYRSDLEAGRITPDEALELIEHFYLKLFSIIKLRPEKHSRTQSGYPMYQNMVTGGQTTGGKEATNELSYLCLAALVEVRLSEPNFYIRIHENTPEEFLTEALQVVKLGFGMPAFVNDKVIVPSLVNRGVSETDALNYSTMGCLEVQVPGKWGYRANGKSKVNLLKILELVLNDGRDPKAGIQLKKGRGDIATLKTFPDLITSWREQLEYYTRIHVTADNINDKALEELVPNAFCSAFVHDCLTRGKHLNEGGAVYDMTSGALVGLPNVGNALAALKKLVYEEEERRLSGADLKNALKNNFSGNRGEEIRHLLLNRAPKYGEDEDEVDELTASVLNDYAKIIPGFKNMRHKRGPIGGNYYPSTVTISANVPAGLVVGATPDGRWDREPTADGVSPSRGTGRKGPTAIMKSVSKLPTVLMTGGQLLNLRITNSSLGTADGLAKLSALIRGFFDLSGWHVQINTVSTEVLKDAMRHPENYRDLIVRVAGYSALFVSLDPALQLDIISRLEHEI